MRLTDGASSGLVIGDAIRLEQLQNSELDVEVDGLPTQTGADIAFGEVLQLTPATKAVQISNLGIAPLVVGTPSLVSGSGFSLSGWTGRHAGPGRKRKRCT